VIAHRADCPYVGLSVISTFQAARTEELTGNRVYEELVWRGTRDAERPTKPLHKIPNQTQLKATQQPTALGQDIASPRRWPLVPRIPAF
jgi:hypothetical protein